MRSASDGAIRALSESERESLAGPRELRAASRNYDDRDAALQSTRLSHDAGGIVKRLAILLLLSSSCLFSQSDHCGDEYTRNMTHLKPGLYQFDGDALAGVKQLRVTAKTIVIEADDGHRATYTFPN
jgi:hypothetical protein